MLDNLRDRRTLLSALLLGPLFGPIIFTAVMGFALSTKLSDLDDAIELPVQGIENAPNLVRFLEQNNVEIEAIGVDVDAQALVRDKQYDAVLVIPPDYGERFTSGEPAPLRLVNDQSSVRSGKATDGLRRLLSGYGKKTAYQRLLARGVSQTVIEPLAIENVDVSTPVARSILLLGMITYFFVFSMLIGGMYLAIDATAGERERGSLESLLTLPVPRADIILGKILATCLFMSISLMITIAAFYFTIDLIPLERLGMSANFSLATAAQVFAVMVPFVPFAAALLTVVATFTKSYKEAQSYLSLVLVIPTIPIMLVAIYGLQSSLELMFIPSLSQHLLATELIKNEPPGALLTLVSVGATLALGAILIWLTTRRYAQESILG